MTKWFLPVMLSSLMFTQVSSSQVAASPEASKSAFPANSADIPVENVAFLPNLPALPPGKATVLGGKINRLDRVREELTLQIFGGGHTKILFDGRTHIYLNGVNAGRRDLRDGQRVHLDTVLDGTKVFAKNIYVLTSTSNGSTGESYGQVLRYKAGTGELILNESLSATTVRLKLVPSTTIRHHDHPISPEAIRPGSLVSVTFDAEGDGRAVAREISVLAEPGDVFEFTGRVTHLDMRAGLLVVEDLLDQKKSYEINFNASLAPAGNGLHEGVNVTVSIGFDGTRYMAKTLTVNSSTSK
jgi:hypothetical protein